MALAARGALNMMAVVAVFAVSMRMVAFAADAGVPGCRRVLVGWLLPATRLEGAKRARAFP